MTKTYHDDLGRVFDRMQLQHGECFDFPFGVADDETAALTWRWFSHVDHDGIGALAQVLGDYGHELAAPRLRIRPDRRAAWHEHLRPMLRRSYLRAAPRSPWEIELATPASRRLPQELLELSEDETHQVAAVARSLSISVNSLVLWAVATAVRSLAAAPAHRQHWTVPVNMRGAMPETAANQLSFIRVPIRPGDSPEAIHARVYDLLQTGTHWVMLRWIAFFANRASMKFPPVRSTGCLSNLGAYRGDGPARIAFSPPCGTTEPIGAGVISWNGRMTLALTCHDSLAAPPGALATIAARLQELLLTGQSGAP